MRSFRIRFSIFWTILLLTLNISTTLAEESHDTAFEYGVKAFSQGEYKKAAEFFEASRKAEDKSLALYYNLGVSYFKLKNYSEARKNFKLLTSESNLAPLAHYNLGLVALKGSDKQTAKKHFQITFRTAKEVKLRQLAKIQLDNSAGPKRKIWSGFFSVAGGYDDNVALNIDNTVEASDIKDEFVEVIGGASAQLAGTRANGLQLSSTIYSKRYREVKEFSFDNLRIGPEMDRKIGKWNTTLKGFVDWGFIDGNLFESIFSAEITGNRKIHNKLSLRLRYRLSRINASSAYESQSGTRHRLISEIRSNINNIFTRLGYTLELNNRNDLSFPTRHSIYFSANRNLTNILNTELTCQYRYSNYKNINRNDRRFWLTFKLYRDIPWKLRLFGKYDFIKNSSNIDQSDYTSNIISIGIERFF